MTKFPLGLLQTVSGVIKFFDTTTRDMAEGLWYSYHIAIEELRKRAKTVADAESCVHNEVNHTASLTFSLFTAMPVYLNPMSMSYQFKAVSSRTSGGYFKIEIDELSYRQIYGAIAYSDSRKRLYVIDGENAFKVMDMSTTADGRSGAGAQVRYWLLTPEGGEIIDGASIYVTTGLTHRIDDNVLELPYLRVRSTDEGTTQDGNEKFLPDTDFVFWPESKTVEFMPDVANRLSEGAALFCQDAKRINTDLYSVSGGPVGINSWQQVRVDNPTAAAIINSAGQAILGSGDLAMHQRCLAVQYRIPVADRDYVVVGQIETFGYSIKGLTLVSNGQHTGPVMIDKVLYKVASNVIVSVIGTQAMPTDLTGKQAHPFVAGRYDVVKYFNNDADWFQSLHVIDPYSGIGTAIAAIYDTCVVASQGLVLPSGILEVDGTKSVIHFVSQTISGDQLNKTSLSSSTKLMCYKYDKSTDEYPLYHDMPFPAQNANDNSEHAIGTMVFMMPRHKTLVMTDDNGVEVRYPIDSPLYSRLNPGDIVKKGDILCENVTVETSATMPGVGNAICFRYNSKVISDNCIFETVQVNQIAEYGKDYPDKVVEVS